jgi:hypothetical protein
LRGEAEGVWLPRAPLPLPLITTLPSYHLTLLHIWSLPNMMSLLFQGHGPPLLAVGGPLLVFFFFFNYYFYRNVLSYWKNLMVIVILFLFLRETLINFSSFHRTFPNLKFERTLSRVMLLWIEISFRKN